MFKKHVLCVLATLIAWSQAMAASPVTVRQESQLLYTDLQDGKTDWVQMAIQILSLNDAEKIPRFIDIYGVTQKTEGIRNVVVVRSSFYLPMNVADIRARMANPMTLSQYSKNTRMASCTASACEGKLKTGFASMAVKLNYGIVDKTNVPAAWQKSFQSLHQPDFVSAQQFTEIESVFQDGSSYTALYKMNEGLTWAQSYQVFTVKESAYQKAALIPFFNLEKLIRGTVRDMILDARSSVLQEQKYAVTTVSSSRMPAASEYDKNLYQQKFYQLVDPAGDKALIERAQVVPWHSVKALFSADKFTAKEDPWRPEAWELEDPLAGKVPEPKLAPGPSIQGRDKPIQLNAFSEMIDQVLREESSRGMQISEGVFHRWAPETLYSVHSPVLAFSKLFVCLTMGFTNRFMTTGHERELWNWMIQQSYRSITFPEMFRTSLRLNKGDVYLTLLTVENLLSMDWRAKDRETLPATKRLRPITSGYNYEGDRFGSWYHFFGMILYGYTTSSGHRSNLVGRLEAVGSNALSPGKDQTQKQWFNKLGGFVGDDLRASVHERTYLQGANDPEALKEDFYLNRSEDFRDRLPVVQSTEFKIQVQRSFDNESSSVRITNVGNQDFESCTVDIMTDQGGGYYSPFKFTRQDVTVRAQQTVELSLAQVPPRGIRLFVNSCQRGSPQAVELRQAHWRPSHPKK